MDYRYIEQLLENYWECLTTPQEEMILRQFFSQEDVPASLLPYRDLFLAESGMAEEHLGSDFDERVLRMIEEEQPQEGQMMIGRKASIINFRPFVRAAASVAIVLLIGMAAEQSMHDDQGVQAPTGIIAEDPDAEYNSLSGEMAPNTSARLETVDTLSTGN